MDQLQFTDESTDLSASLEEKLSDLSELFSSFSHLGAVDVAGLEARRNDVLTDRLISVAEQLAELSYKVSDAAFLKHEELTHRRKAIVLVFAVLFGINSFLLLVLIRYRVVRPLEQIEQVANDIRAGNLSARVHSCSAGARFHTESRMRTVCCKPPSARHERAGILQVVETSAWQKRSANRLDGRLQRT